jgi:endonuclease/exonuclease/phosphatase family metal-dependent hydrolase
MLPIRRAVVALFLLVAISRGAESETITLATYNVEHFQEHFYAHQLTQKLAKEKKEDADIKEMLFQLRKMNDEDNWETALVITDRDVNPDILVIEEGCTQDNLEYFNKRWLHSAYETVIQFPSNTGDRNQHLNMLIKPGFKVLQKKDQYYLEKDPTPNSRGDKLFARGPSFVLVQSPGGYKFWVGVTHQKSKRIDFDREHESAMRKELSGQPKAVIDEKIKAAKTESGKSAAEWRNREAKRTHEIMKALAATAAQDGSADVILLGDMNDDLGMDENEKLAGADAIELLVGPKDDNFFLATRALAEKGEISFGGYFRPDYRSFIDHVVVTPAMKERVADVRVFHGGVAKVSSDHYPVVVKVKGK